MRLEEGIFDTKGACRRLEDLHLLVSRMTLEAGQALWNRGGGVLFLERMGDRRPSICFATQDTADELRFVYTVHGLRRGLLSGDNVSSERYECHFIDAYLLPVLTRDIPNQ